MASNITVDTLTKGSTTLNTDEIVDTNSNQICKAWVNFNGIGTVAIKDSYNVSSITDNGTGDYDVNFTTARPSTNYSVGSSCGRDTLANFDRFPSTADHTTTKFGIQTFIQAGSKSDVSTVCAQVFGD